MVEGPGATRNARKVQPVVGLVLRELSIDNGKSTSGGSTFGESNRLEGRFLDSAFSVGKEVFLVFGPILSPHEAEPENKNKSNIVGQDRFVDPEKNKPIALRLHFGMNGCLVVRTIGKVCSQQAPRWKRRDTTSNRCAMRFGSDAASPTTVAVVETVASTCTIVSAAVARSKLLRLQNNDVCGGATIFQPLAVLESIVQKRSASMVCDALLDQERFPGVGNIIKIEGLHRARVHPRRLVENLSRDELLATILECRNYAMGWLSSGRSPSKKVYNQTRCSTCQNGRVRMVKMGKDLSRVTFWCECCQPLDAGRSGRASASTFGNNAGSRRASTPSNTNTNNINNAQERPTTAETTIATTTTNLRPRQGCPQHGSKRVLLRRVRNKSSSNLHRLFWTCGVRGCMYFSWADSHFPSCGCVSRGTKRVVLRVSKTERTGGRWFLSCPANASSNTRSSSSSVSRPESMSSGGCSFFQWATPDQLAPFGDDLSPLT